MEDSIYSTALEVSLAFLYFLEAAAFDEARQFFEVVPKVILFLGLAFILAVLMGDDTGGGKINKSHGCKSLVGRKDTNTTELIRADKNLGEERRLARD